MSAATTAESNLEGRTSVPGGLDPRALRAEFPVLGQLVHGDKPLVYLDNAATSQKPQCAIDAIRRYYEEDNANIHRGVHVLSQRATEQYERAREKARRFVNAARVEEIVFVRGTTEAINLVAQSYGRPRLRPGDEILITTLEHHSNIVPWQMLREQTGAVLRVAPIDDRGQILMDEFERLLSPKTKIVAVGHVSNALGTINPVERIVEAAHAVGAVVLIDGAQAVPHMAADVRALGCDFYAFSAHKMYGPTGVGVLYGRADLLDAMPPWMGGGDMIASVTFDKTTYNVLPYKFEAGTPNIAGGIGLGAAIDFMDRVGVEAIAAHEHDLLEYGLATLAEIPGMRFVGTAERRAGVISFELGDVHPHDVGTIVDAEGVAIRTGHHCAQPVMDRFGVPATNRASFACYNAREDIDALARALRKVVELFA